MARDTKLRTRTQEGKVEVLVLVNHPMETGMRKDKASGKPIAAHFIKELTLEHNGKLVAAATMADNRWVYISTVVVNKPLDQKTLQKRQVIVIDFDPSGTVAGITDKSAADGKTIEPDSSQTKTYGQSLGILDSVMENMGSLGGK